MQSQITHTMKYKGDPLPKYSSDLFIGYKSIINDVGAYLNKTYDEGTILIDARYTGRASSYSSIPNIVTVTIIYNPPINSKRIEDEDSRRFRLDAEMSDDDYAVKKSTLIDQILQWLRDNLYSHVGKE